MDNNKRRRIKDLSEYAEPIYFVIISTCLLAFIIAAVVIRNPSWLT